MNMNEFLLASVAHGDVKAVKESLKNGADIEARNYLGRTVLMIAVACGHTETAEMLLKNGAKAEVKDKNDD